MAVALPRRDAVKKDCSIHERSAFYCEVEASSRKETVARKVELQGNGRGRIKEKQMGRETVKLLNVLRRIARAAGYAAWVKADPGATQFCVAQYNRVLTRL